MKNLFEIIRTHKLNSWILLISCFLIIQDVEAQIIQYPTIDSVKVIPETPLEYVDQLKAVVYSKHKRTNCELDSTYFVFSGLGYNIYLRANYYTDTTETDCFRIDTIPLVGLHIGDHTLHLYTKTYSDIDILVDTILIPFTVYDDVGLQEENNLFNLNLFPNPVSDILNFSLKDNSNFLKLEIFDVSGKRIKFKEYFNHSNEEFKGSLDVSELKNGIYFCKFSDGEKAVTRKFIKQ